MADIGRQNRRSERFAVALATGSTVRRAAHLAGISERTATRWAAMPAIVDRVNQLRAATMTDAVGQLTYSMTAAAETLKRLLKSKSDTVRLAASRCIIEMAVRTTDQLDLAQRLTALEERQRTCELDWSLSKTASAAPSNGNANQPNKPT